MPSMCTWGVTWRKQQCKSMPINNIRWNAKDKKHPRQNNKNKWPKNATHTHLPSSQTRQQTYVVSDWESNHIWTWNLFLNLLSLAICITKHITDFLRLSSSGFSPHSTSISCCRKKNSHTTIPCSNKNLKMFLMARPKAYPV